MNVLHLYPATNPLIVKHVTMLDQGCTAAVPDIVHVHGCWSYTIVRQALRLHQQGVRIVFTPHGGLEPWVIAQRRFSEKLYKTLLWQRRLVERSYVIIAHGAMETKALEQLKWNPRIETIRNAVVTNSITPEAMTQHTQDVYHKVMDSNTVELMNKDTHLLMAILLKAGITGDKRWITVEPPSIDDTEWRRLLVYADHENVRATIDAGNRVLGLHHDYVDTAQIKSYLPTYYHKPRVSAYDVNSIVSEMHRGPLTLRHFVALDKALRRDNVNDEWLTDALTETHLLKYFRRLLQVLTEVTLLDEGFLPAKPLNDRRTQTIRNLLNNYLRI